MSAADWEERFVRVFVVKEKQDRYADGLRSSKRRTKILDRLNHSFDYDEAKARALANREFESADALCGLLRSLGVAETCFYMADDNDLDGAELSLEMAVDDFLFCEFGAVIICPPKPIGIYKGEGRERPILLR